MTIKICDHEFKDEVVSRPSHQYQEYRVEHPPADRNAPIPEYEVYTAQEVNELLANLKAELLKEIAASNS